MTSDDSSIIIGVPLKGFIQWGGGIDIIRLILEGLLHDPNVKVVVLIPRPTRIQRMRGYASALLRRVLQGKTRPESSVFPDHENVKAAIDDFLPRVARRFHADTPRGMLRALHTCGVTVAIPCLEPMPSNCSVAWVGYLYDFQHKYLPQYFSDAEREIRDFAFSRMIKVAPAMVCNSEAVRSDAELFYPNSSTKIVSLPFAPVPRAEWFNLDPQQVRGRYGISSRYFIICNQFWIHKDHPTAIKAFAEFLLRGRERDVDLVCTGSLDDYRAPSHMANIRELISHLGLDGRVHLVGRIPKQDQVALLQGAIALLQPTLFEGGSGGGAVYDAVALGVPALVSGIEVNREIKDANCQFFTQGDPSSLAGAMIRVAESEPSRMTQAELMAKSQGRIGPLHLALMKAIRLAQDGFRVVSPR